MKESCVMVMFPFTLYIYIYNLVYPFHIMRIYEGN